MTQIKIDSKKPNIILFPTMGEGSMPDSLEVKKSLEAKGFEVLEVDFLQSPQETVKKLP